MPELPEVETIRRGLKTKIISQKITDVEILEPNSAQFDNEMVKSLLIGSKIDRIRRRGKVLIIDLDRKTSLLIHLKMTGQLVLVKSDGGRFGGGHPTKSLLESLPDRSTRIVFTLENGNRLFFNDQRKFGWIKLLATEEVDSESLLKRMGPEAWNSDLKASYLRQRAKGRKLAIKPFILDQSVIAGVGNIYADEALHYAQLHPERPAGQVKLKELEKLVEGIGKVMQKSINSGGTSFSDYVNHLGFYGDYLRGARVFRREGQPCEVCGMTIIKTKVAGRGTHLCPKCQKK